MTERMQDWIARHKDKKRLVDNGAGNYVNHRGFDDGRAHDIQVKRWEDCRNSAADGMLEAVNNALEEKAKKEQKEIHDIIHVNKATTTVAAWKHVIAHAVDVYMRTNTPKGLSDLGNFIGKSTGMLRQPDDKATKEDGLPLPALDEAYRIVNFFIMQDPEKNKKLQEYVDVQMRDANV